MTKNPIKADSADDFSVRMRITRSGYDTAVESLRAQIRLLWAQGIITENAMQVLFQSVTEIAKNWTLTETNYYEMRNILEKHENNKERLFSWFQAMSYEDSARGQFARETLNYAEQKD